MREHLLLFCLLGLVLTATIILVTAPGAVTWALSLIEALEQQTATSEVLQVISSSPGELEPVFQAMLENAVRVCEAKFGVLFRYSDNAYHVAATLDVPPTYAEFLGRRSFRPDVEPALAGSPLHRLLLSKEIIQSDDVSLEANPGPASQYGGARSYIAVPLKKENELVGAFVIYRQEVRPFTDKHIELVTNFAAQAVIAIENTRLLNELRQRTDDLSEALEQQTATSEVLQVISRSPGELAPVFEAMLANAVRICEAKFGVMFRFDGDVAYAVAMLNLPPALDDYLRQRGRRQPAPGSDLEKVLKLKQVIHTIDSLETPNPIPPARLAGARTCITVPMLKETELVGAIVIYRQEVRPFTDKQVALVKNFAAQAVIAIENARLLCCGCSERNNDIDLEPDELGRNLAVPLGTAPGPAKCHCHVTTFGPAEFAQSLDEGGHPRARLRQRARTQESNRRQFACLLRARRERPGSRAAEQRDERAASHSITSSARNRNDSGIVKPIALAVVRLMTSSNLDGCSTGISPGFVPRKTLSTNSAVRRNRSGKFGP
jgi:GAF domain-containing protein